MLNTISAFLGGGAVSAFVAISTGTSPFVYVYPWLLGFGTKLSDPATLPTGTANGVSFNPAGNTLVVTHAVTPVISVYPISAAGFGTKYTNPSPSLLTNGTNSAWKADGTVLATGIIAGNIYLLAAYAWSNGFGSKYADPATLPTGSVQDVAWNGNSDIAITDTNSPYILAYPWSAGFGTKYANPATLPPAAGASVEFNPAGNAIAVGHNTTPFVSAYPWSSGFGTKYANPATLPSGGASGVAWNTSGADIAISTGISPYIQAYPWSSGFGTKYANPATLPNGGTDVAFI